MDQNRQAGRRARALYRKGFQPTSVTQCRLSIEKLELRHMLSANPVFYPGSEADAKQDDHVHDHSHSAIEDVFIPPSAHLYDPRGYLSGPKSGNALDIAIDYLISNSIQLGLQPSDLTGFEVSSQYVSQHTGVTHIYLTQTFADLEVVGAHINVNVSPLGEVINVGSSFVPGLGGATSLIDSEPTIDAGEALIALAEIFGWTIDAAPEPLSDGEHSSQFTASQLVMLPASGLSLEDIPAELVYVPLEGGSVELAWRLLVQTVDYAHAYDASVSSTDGDLLFITDWVDDASYNVYGMPTKSPQDGDRSVVVDPQDPIASPFGWHDTNGAPGAEHTVTRGNNVHAYADRNDDDQPDVNSSPNGGAGLLFDYLLNLSQAPSTYTPAAVTNLFYWNNIIHDVLYQYGFDEPSGNFQVNNYGNGGLGNDDVRAEAQDGGGTNNANFFTPPDGQRPRMQMYEFTRTSINRDGDLDNMIIVHEYGHGVSNRLTGGPANAGALSARQSGGMGEGWSDWFGLMLTQEASDAKTAAYPVGTYVMGHPANGAGIRRYPYSFNMSVDPLTYDYYNQSSQVHNAGEIWASTLWDLNWLLIDEYGFDPDIYNGNGGNNLAMQLVIDGMKLQPVNPSFLDARDAILLADQALTGGVNNLIIWTAFARRGMGFSAYDGGSANATQVIAAFDMPATRQGVVQFDADGYKIGDTISVTLRDLDLIGQATVNLTVSTSGGDSETITLGGPDASSGSFTGILSTAATPHTSGNGTLEIAVGDTITVTYNDANDGTGSPATVSDTATVFNLVNIYEANMDTNPGWTFTGQWAWGRPLGLGSHNRDPSSGHTGTNVVGYNLAGDYPDNIPAYYATTQAIDCTDYENVSFGFWRWMGIEDAFWDSANIQVSNNGTTWQTIWAHSSSSFSETSWSYHEFDISAIADGEDTVYIRWGLGPTDSSVTYPGWNIDDVVVTGSPLTPSTVGTISGRNWNDRNGDGNHDSAEPGLAGWVIYLDQNNDGKVVTDHRLEPDDYPEGTLLNTAQSQVTLSAVGATTGDVFAGVPVGVSPSTGNLGFTHADPSGWGEGIQLRLDFEFPVDFISIDAIGGPGSQTAVLELYDAAGNLLDSDTSNSLSVGTTETLSVTRPSADAAYAVVRATSGNGLGLDNLAFVHTDVSTVTDASGFYQFIDLPPGEYRVRELERSGWVQTYPGDSPLDATLNRLTANYSAVTALVPNRFNFSEGATGSNIFDGGSDMYDTGNFLNTDIGTIVPYTDRELTSGDAWFGEGSQYFTAKFQGMFVLAATNTSMNEFFISGSSGTDGLGAVDGTVLTTVVNDRQYTIFVKRTFSAGDPSINHIIMVPGDGTGISHSFPTDTNEDMHVVTGLSSVEEIYYALVSRDNGGYLDDSTVLNIANKFLGNVAFAERSVLNVVPGSKFSNVNFGNRALPGSIRGEKWNDLNDNGIKDEGEPSLAGWRIFIDNNRNGQLDAGEKSTLTDSSGKYIFLGLEPGEYHIGEVLQPGWRQTYPGVGQIANLIVNGNFEIGTLNGWTLVDTDSGTISINDGTLDPDGDDGPLPPLNGLYSAMSHQPGPGKHELYQDVLIPAGSNLTLSWIDQIRNHAPVYVDPNQEFRVEIRNTSNQLLQTVFSTNPGDPLLQEPTARSVSLAAFAGQTIRIAFVEEDDQLYFNVHLDEITISGSGAQGTIPVTVEPNQDILGINFGNYVLRGSIAGYKWHDLDQDGVRDQDEPALAGWTVYLDDNNDEALGLTERSTQTAADGSFSFDDLIPGTYVVRELPQNGWLHTFPMDSAPRSIAVFDDPDFVDSNDTKDSESDNVQQSLTSLGFQIYTFTGTSASSWATALSQADAVLFPELELGNLAEALLPDAIATLRAFVEAGGGLIINGSHGWPSNAAGLLNTVFGFALEEGNTGLERFFKMAGATGTEFGDDPFDLPLNNGMAYLNSDTLPAGSLSLYENSFQSVAALMHAGAGKIAYLGYDWFDAAPAGAQDGGWIQALESAVLETARRRGVPGPHRLTVAPEQTIQNINFGSFRNAVPASADFDGDGDVDGRDFLAWQRGYGSSSATREQGDANGDGLVDGADLTEWQDTYGQPGEVVGFVADDESDFGLVSLSGLAGCFTNLVSPEVDSGPAFEGDSQLGLLDDAFSKLSEPTSWHSSDFGDIAVCRDSDEELEFDTEFDELLLSAFGR